MLFTQSEVLRNRHFNFEINNHMPKGFVLWPETNVANEVGNHIYLFFFVVDILQNQTVVVEFTLVTRPSISRLFNLGV